MNKAALVGIIVLAAFLRLYKLGDVPNGLYQDETAIGYNAYSILQTGKDERGVSYPLYFKSFGDWKLPVYIYATVPAIKIFGLTPFAVRLPSAIFGILTVVAMYFLAKELTKSHTLSLVSCLLLSVNPWHLHYSRATFEVSISLFLFVFGTYLLLQGFKGNKGAFLAGTLLFVLNIYTYNLTRLLSPLLYASILIFQRKKHINITEKGLTIALSCLLLLPLLLTLNSSGGATSASGTLLWSSAAIQAPLLELRSYMMTLPDIITRLFFNSFVLNAWQYMQNVANFFSPSFFFVSGPTHGNHGIGTSGLFYLFELPMILYGIVSTIKKREAWGGFLFIWTIVVIAVVSLTREVPHATRSFFLLVPLTLFSAYGAIHLYRFIAHHIALLVIAGGLVFYGIFSYFSSYYIRFPIAFAKAWRTADRDLSEYIKENELKYDTIILDPATGFIYSSLLFYNQISPKIFQSTAMWTSDDSEGFSTVTSFDKYKFRNIDWGIDTVRPRTLIVTTAQNKPETVPAIKSIYYPKRPVVLSLKQEIFQYPVEDIAYVIVASNP